MGSCFSLRYKYTKEDLDGITFSHYSLNSPADSFVDLYPIIRSGRTTMSDSEVINEWGDLVEARAEEEEEVVGGVGNNNSSRRRNELEVDRALIENQEDCLICREDVIGNANLIAGDLQQDNGDDVVREFDCQTEREELEEEEEEESSFRAHHAVMNYVKSLSLFSRPLRSGS